MCVESDGVDAIHVNKISHLSYKCEMCVIAQRYGCVWSNDGFCVIHLFLCHSKSNFSCVCVIVLRWCCVGDDSADVGL